MLKLVEITHVFFGRQGPTLRHFILACPTKPLIKIRVQNARRRLMHLLILRIDQWLSM